MYNTETNILIDKLIELSSKNESLVEKLGERIEKLECKARILEFNPNPEHTTYNQLFSLIMDIQERIACNNDIITKRLDYITEMIGKMPNTNKC